MHPTSPRLNFQLGRAYCAAKNFHESLPFFVRAAEQGYAAAETALGDAFQSGTGVSQSYSDAIEWYTKAAKQGFAIAQNSLGVMYEQGLGSAREIIVALDWYRKAAKQGDSAAQANLTRLVVMRLRIQSLSRLLHPALRQSRVQRRRPCLREQSL